MLERCHSEVVSWKDLSQWLSGSWLCIVLGKMLCVTIIRSSGDGCVSKGFSKSSQWWIWTLKPTDLGSHSLRHTHVKFGAAMLHYWWTSGPSGMVPWLSAVVTCALADECGEKKNNSVTSFQQNVCKAKEVGNVVVQLLTQRMDIHTILRGWIAFWKRIREYEFLGWHLGWDIHLGEFYIATSLHLTSNSFRWNPPKMNWHLRNHVFTLC